MRVVVIGGGAAGLHAAGVLKQRGVESVIIEREELGGKLNQWDRLFPTFTSAGEVLERLPRDVETVQGEAAAIVDKGVLLKDGRVIEGDAVIVATGFELFPAGRKEELGYGVYDNVVTTVDLEAMMRAGSVTMTNGEAPRRIAILHCVGSRDEKVGQRHCSRVCCITAVKQAMELREMIPDCEVFNFYMDMRMFGSGWEELYRRAQEQSRVQFIRGRISEASQTQEGRVWIKAEDTLLGRPLRMSVDMLVLAVGMMAPAGLGLTVSESGFVAPRDPFLGGVEASRAGVFVAGCASGPKTIGESLASAAAAAEAAAEYVNALTCRADR